MKYIVYTKKDCPYCVKALQLLEDKNLQWASIDLQDSPDVLQSLKEAYNWKTVPMVFLENTNIETQRGNPYELVGGYSDLEDFLNE
jgi:glutaredoxin 3|tara:strand:+ start:683 stop:940 length:258 start_codon:yes stop_codon:yes gene_type:complete